MPKASFMTPLGHFEAHMPQETQRLSSMTGWLSSSLMAPMGQFFTHIPQAMQPASQTLRAVSYTHLDVYKRQGRSWARA